jgi:outer membrane cobalamin receptor
VIRLSRVLPSKLMDHVRQGRLVGALFTFALSVVPAPLRAQTPPVLLDTLQVQVGSRVSRELPVLTRSVQLLGRKEIDALPVRTVSGLLEWATSVDVQSRSPAQSDLGIRGAGFEQVVVLVNGVRMSDPQTGHFDLDLAVPLDQVERLEILRGPASALYGADAVGGVVNIVTRGSGESWRGLLEGGSWGTGRVSGGGGFEREGGLSLQLGGEFGRSDGHRAGTDYESALLHLALSHPLGPGRLTGDFGGSRRDYGAQDFYAPYPSFERTRSYTSSVRWEAEARHQLTMEFGTSFRRHEDEFTLIRDDPAVYQNRHTSSQVGGDVLVRGGSWMGMDLSAGGELYQDILRSNSLGDREENRGAVYVETALGGRGPGVMSVGLRHDWHQGFGSFFSPSVSGSYRVGPSLRTRAALGRSFRAPSWTERYYQDPANVGREDLAPERAWSGEVGLDLASSSDLRLSVTAFLRRAEGLIDWARPVGAGDDTPWETRNVEEATFKGLEADLTLQGPSETRWTLGGMLLSVDSKEIDGYRSKYALRPLEEQVNLAVGRTFGDAVTLSLNLKRGKRAAEDAYHRLDLRGGVKLGSTWLYLDANNLLNERYPDVTGALAPGRAVYLGWRWGGEDRNR